MFSKSTVLYALALLSVNASAQDFSFTNTGLSTLSSVSTNPTSTGSGYSFRTSDGQITVTTSRSRSSSVTGSGSASLSTSSVSGASDNSTASSSSSSGQSRRTTSQELTALVGTKAASSSSMATGASNSTMSSNSTATASRSSSAAVPINTTPCNNHVEFCNRKYSNITQVCAHNSAFAIKNNAGSNQQFGITEQLNDGVRIIQGESQPVNGTMYACHTSCDLLNAGTYQNQLNEVAQWVENHPYDVVTVMIGNSAWRDGITVLDYVDAIQNSGLAPYLYEPAYVPQYLDQWPTLSEMILTGKRVVMFIDYNANQTAVPYVLDQYSHYFSTPFSPTDRGFPCTLQLPLELDNQTARERYMYIANHNLNTPVSFAGLNILIPNTANINETNGMYDQYGQLQAMVSNCTVDWGRPPNALVVDYYNRGYPMEGSVFHVAAAANNVTYNLECCGLNSSNDSPLSKSVSMFLLLGTALAFWLNM